MTNKLIAVGVPNVMRATNTNTGSSTTAISTKLNNRMAPTMG